MDPARRYFDRPQPIVYRGSFGPLYPEENGSFFSPRSRFIQGYSAHCRSLTRAVRHNDDFGTGNIPYTTA